MSIVETSLGRVEGVRAGPTWAFLGVPYAAPPVGSRRWRPPEPAAPWAGVRDGSIYPNRAPQEALSENLMPAGGLKGKPNEDCLPMPEHYVFSGEPRRDDRLLAIREPERVFNLRRAVKAPLRAGSATIHGYATPHFTGPNLGARGRRAFIFSFNHPELGADVIAALRREVSGPQTLA